MYLSSITAALSALVMGVGLAAGTALAQSVVQPDPATDEVWAGLVTDVFDDRPMVDGTGILDLEAPRRAEDAAIVPMAMTVKLPPDDPRTIRKITLIIDQNPAPVAAVFELGEKAGIERIETRVRVNSYTKVHAVAEASDGTLFMTEKFVKASGGCSAPATKDAVAALENLGQMKFREFQPVAAADGTKRSEAQVMMRHPQYSGLQMDQVTRTYTPAWFIQDLTVKQGEDLIFKVTGGISLSEDPVIRFSYLSNGADTITVDAIDTEEKIFRSTFPVATGGT